MTIRYTLLFDGTRNMLTWVEDSADESTIGKWEQPYVDDSIANKLITKWGSNPGVHPATAAIMIWGAPTAVIATGV